MTPRVEAAVADSWRRTHGDLPRSLVILGDAEWKMVSRLQRSGWLTLTVSASCRDLLGRPSNSELSRAERLKLGRDVLADAERQYKVAQLLREGGCVVEAVPAARGAALTLGRLLAWLQLDGLGTVPELCTGGLVMQLRDQGVLSPAALRVLGEARSIEEPGELRSQWFHQQVDELFAESAPYFRD